jgi:arylsulfatase A-like enzyme
MTGRYPAESGVVNLAIPMNPDEFTLSKAFKGAGYRTGYVGKWHLAGDHDLNFHFIPPGPRRVEIDDWHVWEATNNHYHCYTFDPNTGAKIMAQQWAPVDMTDQTISLLENYAKQPNQPFFLMLSYNPPHPPFNPPDNDRALDPIAMQKYRPNTQVGKGGPAFLSSADQFHTAMQGYLGGISGIDTEFGRLMAALDRLDLTKDTVVIFTSDHGEMMGSQGKGGKILPYDESNHVPFFARYPGVTPKGRSTELLGAIDIYPTVCGLAGIPVPSSCSGKDYSNILRGKQSSGAEMVFLQGAPGRDNGSGEANTRDKAFALDHAQHAPLYYRGVRTKRYTYAVREDGRWLLFDNVADPYQMKNLAGDAAHHPLMDGFDTELKAWMKRTGDAFQMPANPRQLSTESGEESEGDGF